MSIMKSKKNATSVKKSFVIIKIKSKFKSYKTVRDHCHIQEHLEELLIAFVI